MSSGGPTQLISIGSLGNCTETSSETEWGSISKVSDSPRRKGGRIYAVQLLSLMQTLMYGR